MVHRYCAVATLGGSDGGQGKIGVSLEHRRSNAMLMGVHCRFGHHWSRNLGSLSDNVPSYSYGLGELQCRLYRVPVHGSNTIDSQSRPN
jgi:hypothetical protein